MRKKHRKNSNNWVSVSVSDFEGVVSISNGQVSVSVPVSDDEVSVSDSEAETPSLDLT